MDKYAETELRFKNKYKQDWKYTRLVIITMARLSKFVFILRMTPVTSE
jgi:hypothetical protein